MLRTTLKVAWRALLRRKGTTALNVAGLALGLAGALLIALWIQHERSFDRFHTSGDRIYRVVVDYITDGRIAENGFTQGILGPTLEEDYPEVEQAVRLTSTGNVLRVGDRQFEEGNLAYADADLFAVFDFPFLHGDPATALAEPLTIVLTEAMALKYFDRTDVVGETMATNERVSNEGVSLTVTGVVEATPETSSVQADGLVSMITLEQNGPDWMWGNWYATNFQTYVLLQEGVTQEAMEANMVEMFNRYARERGAEFGSSLVFLLEPLETMYLTSKRDGVPHGSLANIYLFGVIALFLVLIACINFANLSTARSMERAKEVGVRKTVGGTRTSLALQFLAEAVMLTTASMVLALLLVQAVLPAFERLTEKTLSLATLGLPAWGLLTLLLGTALAVGVLAGTYPAFVLTRFHPAAVLKGTFRTSASGAALRKGLVVVQFAISIALIAATAVVFRQLAFMQERDLGFAANTEEGRLLEVPFGGDEQVLAQYDALKAQLVALPGVAEATGSQTLPGYGSPSAGGAVEGPDGTAQNVSVDLYMVDFDFLDVMDLDIVAGRGFDPAFSTDSSEAYLLNETAAREFGYTDVADAVGKSAGFWGRGGTIIGIVEDFHPYGLRSEIPTLGLRIENQITRFTLRLKTDDLPATIASIDDLWQAAVPHRPFSYYFVDETFDAQYRAETRFGQVFAVFAVLAIFIACLGLFGLASFTAAQRTKEIGVRKVLGASVPGLVTLLAKDFLVLVVAGFAVAVPVVWYGMSRWLADFAYRTDVGVLVFLLAGGLALGVALLTVTSQSLRAATTDPINALRYE
ncbi:MAG: ABC transporter permease [Bacteroidota bacterium]